MIIPLLTFAGIALKPEKKSGPIFTVSIPCLALSSEGAVS